VSCKWRPRGLSSFAALVVATAAMAGVAHASHSTTAGPNGLIVYAVELKSDQYQLFTIRPDGSNRTQLTRGQGSSLNADWSPDGRSLVYELSRADTAGVAVAALEGSDPPKVLTPTGFQGQPSFSPDGKWIVYERDIDSGNNGVWLMRADGTQKHRVTRNPFMKALNGECGCDTDPNFSPDGKWITFVRVKKDHEQQALFAVRPNGKGLHPLTPYSWEIAVKHDWSPDGKHIVLTDNADFVRPQDSANIVTITPSGSDPTALTTFTGGEQNGYVGSFSPDGKQIVFRLERRGKYALAVIDRGGHNMRLITKLSAAKPRFIDWGTHP